jgi:hypothetical protein
MGPRGQETTQVSTSLQSKGSRTSKVPTHTRSRSRQRPAQSRDFCPLWGLPAEPEEFTSLVRTMSYPGHTRHAPVRVTTRRLAQEVKWGECGSRSSYEAITAPASPVAAFTPFPGSRDRILLNRPPHNAPAITPSRNALRMTPESVKPQAFYMLSSLPRGRRDMRSRRDPKNRCEICSPTARTPSSGLPKLPASA